MTMKLNHFLVLDLKAVRDGEISVSSAGFEFDGSVVTDESHRSRLDQLWCEDLIDADGNGVDGSAVAFLTAAGEQHLARVEQESQR